LNTSLGIADHLAHDLEGRREGGTVANIDLRRHRAQLSGHAAGRRRASAEQGHRIPGGVEPARRGSTDPGPGTNDDNGISLGHERPPFGRDTFGSRYLRRDLTRRRERAFHG